MHARKAENVLEKTKILRACNIFHITQGKTFGQMDDGGKSTHRKARGFKSFLASVGDPTFGDFVAGSGLERHRVTRDELLARHKEQKKDDGSVGCFAELAAASSPTISVMIAAPSASPTTAHGSAESSWSGATSVTTSSSSPIAISNKNSNDVVAAATITPSAIVNIGDLASSSTTSVSAAVGSSAAARIPINSPISGDAANDEKTFTNQFGAEFVYIPTLGRFIARDDREAVRNGVIVGRSIFFGEVLTVEQAIARIE